MQEKILLAMMILLLKKLMNCYNRDKEGILRGAFLKIKKAPIKIVAEKHLISHSIFESLHLLIGLIYYGY